MRRSRPDSYWIDFFLAVVFYVCAFFLVVVCGSIALGKLGQWIGWWK